MEERSYKILVQNFPVNNYYLRWVIPSSVVLTLDTIDHILTFITLI